MTWKLFAQAVRLVNRRVSSPPVRYRPHVDALEDRTVLSSVVFNEVQAQSILTLTGSIDGKKLKPQGAGALTTTFFGTFTTNIDETNGTIRFIQTGNDFCAANTGNWAPMPDGSNGNAPAIYGFQMKSHQQVLEAALRDYHMNADTGGAALPLYQNSDGSFGFPSAQTIAISAASGTYSDPAFGHGSLNFSGWHGPNQAADGQLLDNGHGTLTITVPISVSVSGVVNGIYFYLNVNGQIVGTAGYNGPGPASHSHHDTAIGVVLGSGIRAASAVLTDSGSQGLVPESLPGVSFTTAATSTSAQGGSSDHHLVGLAHHALPAANPLTALDAVFQELT